MDIVRAASEGRVFAGRSVAAPVGKDGRERADGRAHLALDDRGDEFEDGVFLVRGVGSVVAGRREMSASRGHSCESGGEDEGEEFGCEGVFEDDEFGGDGVARERRDLEGVGRLPDGLDAAELQAFVEAGEWEDSCGPSCLVVRCEDCEQAFDVVATRLACFLRVLKVDRGFLLLQQDFELGASGIPS